MDAARDLGPRADLGQPLLAEVAWEVCQQLGGIYTVLRSKAPTMVKQWGRRYVLVGPYDPRASPTEFEESTPRGVIGQAVKALNERGLEAHYGTWLITGRPRVVLLDGRSVQARLDQVKYALWEHHGISLPGSSEFLDGVLAFGYLADQFLRALVAAQPRPRPIVAHFHEWMAGSAIPEMRRDRVNVAIVFQTHATQLGRTLAANDPHFYEHLPGVDWQGAARHYRIEPNVLLERAAAHGAHAFVTLSGITALECEHLLGRRPDLLVPNGLNIERFAAVHEFQNLHRLYKEQIHQFVMAHFFPSYTFDLDRTLYFFSAGRYEPRNKGFDLALEALARLNGRLKRTGTNHTIVFFLITQRPFRSINADLLASRAVMEEMRKTCQAIKDQVGERLFTATAMGKEARLDALLDDYWRLRLHRVAHAWKRRRLPPVVTHDLADDLQDEVLSKIRTSMLFNLADDAVKVVYHPDFIVSTKPPFGMDYDQFVRGCHLGVFPSYYEPWGYTPMECVASGIPAVTSDLSGFGSYLLEHVPDHEEHGLAVIRRRGASWDQSADQLADWLLAFLKLDRRERIAQRNRVERLADHFDWQNLARYYAQAHDLALERAGKG
jgi:glycogen(starch) synthase